MKLILIAISLFILNLANSQSLFEKKVYSNYENKPLKELFVGIEKQLQIKIYFKDSLISKNYVNIQQDSMKLGEILNKILPFNYFASEWNGNIVILKGIRLINKLPEYKFQKNGSNINSSEKSGNKSFIATHSTEVLPVVVVGNSSKSNKLEKAIVNFEIIDIVNEKPIAGAALMVIDKNIGIIADKDGLANMEIKPGKYTVIVKYIGYDSEKYVLDIYGNGTAKLGIGVKDYQLVGVEIFGDKQMDITRKDPGIEKFSRKEVVAIPTMVGETDFIKVSTMLPGISSIGEGSAGINVRGGGYDQNAFFLNGLPIYNTSHLFGFFPAFNPNIIQDLTIYKGYMPPNYGGKLSSVFELSTRKGNKQKFGLRGGISPIATNFMVEGPIIKDTLSFLFSGRTSFSDWILKNIQDTIISKSSAKFNDFASLIDFNNGKSQVSLFGYHSGDEFLMHNTSSYKYFNNGVSLNIGREFNKSYFGDISAYTSNYSFSSSDFRELSAAYTHTYKINQFGLKMELSQNISDKHKLNYGLDFNYYYLDRGSIDPYNSKSFHNKLNLGTEKGAEMAAFISDHFDIADWLNIDIGFRYSTFATLGSDSVYKYIEGLPKKREYIFDTVVYAKKEVIAQNYFPEIRFAANFTTDKNGSIKISFNNMHQNLFLLNTAPALTPGSQWKLSDTYLKPATGNIYSLGVFRKLPRYGINLSTEIFYKQIKNFSEFIDGADFINNSLVETSVLQGDMNSYGLELMVKKSYSKVNGWISYTYSRSLIKVNGLNSWDKINGGEEYPSNYDIPHAFNAVLNYEIRKRMTFSSVVSYQSGRPSTFPVSTYQINHESFIDYSKRNQYRIPDYFRIDLSLTLEGSLKKNKLAHSSLVISVYNLTGRDNPYSVFFESTKGFIGGYQYSVIAVPIFSLTWVFKFGNYATI
ncbi:MAG: hypothetical protein AUJ98_00300 [Bacteroidetes bacterium CG2_30_33_31]|nr:MAG: hypothetical protein AUJ98_00300 [Bacteroidetes bacterium CG2_30_33_31]